MHISRRHVLGWALHLVVSLALVGLGTAPGWREMVVPGTLSGLEWLVVFSARVLTAPLFPVAEQLGIPVWRGGILVAAIPLNSAIWVGVLSLGAVLARRIRAGRES